MTVMTDLKEAIERTLKNADGPLPGDEGVYLVPGNVLYYLQQEYNIHFIEPDEEQGKWI